MAKKPRTKPVGTFLATAVFCEQTVAGDDNTISCIRIIDTVTVEVPHDTPKDVPSEEKRIPITIRGLLSFRRAGAGSCRLKAVMNAPNGKKAVMIDEKIEFKKGEVSTHNARFETRIGIAETGLYWLAILLNGKEYSRMPLLVNVKRRPAEKSDKKKASAAKS
jgi:hypothetical protein